MNKTIRIYKVYDSSGKMIFRGSIPEISKKFYINKSYAYRVAKGRYDSFLGEYTLEYDGEEANIRETENE